MEEEVLRRLTKLRLGAAAAGSAEAAPEPGQRQALITTTSLRTTTVLPDSAAAPSLSGAGSSDATGTAEAEEVEPGAAYPTIKASRECPLCGERNPRRARDHRSLLRYIRGREKQKDSGALPVQPTVQVPP